MARPKSLVLPLAVDRALRRHTCQHNSKHVISQGDQRLKVTVGRSYDHYCVECAKKFIDQAVERLGLLSAELIHRDT